MSVYYDQLMSLIDDCLMIPVTVRYYLESVQSLKTLKAKLFYNQGRNHLQRCPENCKPNPLP